MTNRAGRTLKQVYEQHNSNESERQAYLRELRREEQRRDLEKVQEATNQVIDEYRERRPSLPKGNEGREHSPISPDSRLGYLRNNSEALPLVPLPLPSQDLGQHPDATTYREQINPATGALDTSKRRRDNEA